MILVNGVDAATIPVDDRGLAYGDGVFETMRVRRARLPLLDYHLERLQAGLAALRITPPNLATLRDELARAASEEPNGIAKLTITRGSGGRGYRAPATASARRIVQTFPAPLDLESWCAQGVAVRFCTTPLQGPRALAGLKHLNRLPQVLARAEWDDDGFQEGLMRDIEGRIVEGIRTNVFVRVGEVLVTPPVGAGVRGVMRRLVLELARRYGIETAERHVTDTEFAAADEIFLTNGIVGVCPVIQVEDTPRAIGTMTRLMQKEIENELERRAC